MGSGRCCFFYNSNATTGRFAAIGGGYGNSYRSLCLCGYIAGVIHISNISVIRFPVNTFIRGIRREYRSAKSFTFALGKLQRNLIQRYTGNMSYRGNIDRNNNSSAVTDIVVGVCFKTHIVGSGGYFDRTAGATHPAGGCRGIGVVFHVGSCAVDLSLAVNI